jgi:hypothetical protein
MDCRMNPFRFQERVPVFSYHETEDQEKKQKKKPRQQSCPGEMML